MPKSTIEQEKKLAEALEGVSSFTEDVVAKLPAYLAMCSLNAIARKEAIASGLTHDNGAKQAGRKSKANNGQVVARPLRKEFNKERERQLMKRIATQFFFSLQQYLKKNKINKKLVEIELMHATVGEKHFVFLAANEVDVAAYYQALLGEFGTVKKLLTTQYSPDRDVEGKRRSKRYARKLQIQLFNGDTALSPSVEEADGLYAQAVADAVTGAWVVQDMNARPQQRIHTLLENEPGGVFLLDFSKVRDKARHAEEFLVDTADYIKNYAKEKGLETSFAIAGKKRPCATCSGRMSGEIDRYGKRPGLLWLHAAGRQSPSTFRRTAEGLLNHASHVSLDGRGLKAPHYDSGSDSDDSNGASIINQ